MELMHRIATLDIDTEKGVDSLCFATEETGVWRRDTTRGTFFEHLDHSHADLSVLNDGGPLLANHDAGQVVGEFVKGTVRVCPDKKSRGDVRFFPENAQMREDILDGKKPNSFSVGYDWVKETKRETRNDGLHIWFAWKAFEASCLTDNPPADKKAGLYRTLKMKNRNFESTLQAFLDNALSGTRQHGLTRETIESLRITDVIRGLGNERTGLIAEVHDDLIHGMDSYRCGMGTLYPFEGLLTRDMQTTIQGGAFVPLDQQPIIRLLSNKLAAIPLGATVIPGLTGNVTIPRETATVNPQMLSETGLVAQSIPLFDQLTGKPKRCSVQVSVSNQLLSQGEATEDIVKNIITSAIAVKMDRMVMFGQGDNEEPLGIVNTPGISAMLWGGQATWANVLANEKALADANADIGSIGWAVSISTRNKWKQIPKIAGSTTPMFLWHKGEVNEYPAVATNQLSDLHQTIFGNWQSLYILIFGRGIELIKDPFTKAPEGKTIITANIYFDSVVAHPQAFIVSADAGNL